MYLWAKQFSMSFWFYTCSRPSVSDCSIIWTSGTIQHLWKWCSGLKAPTSSSTRKTCANITVVMWRTFIRRSRPLWVLSLSSIAAMTRQRTSFRAKNAWWSRKWSSYTVLWSHQLMSHTISSSAYLSWVTPWRKAVTLLSIISSAWSVLEQCLFQDALMSRCRPVISSASGQPSSWTAAGAWSNTVREMERLSC